MGKAWGIYALAAGTVCGFLLEAGLLAWGVRRRGFYLVPRWHGLTPPMKKVINQYMPMVAGAFLMSSTSLVNQSMAAMLGPGSVSAFNYGTKVVALVLGIGSISLSTAVFPHFSHMVGVKDWSGVRHTLKTYSYLIVFATVPLAVGLVYFSEPLVRLFFERGAFTSGDTYLVSQVQVLFLLQVPFYFLSILIVRLISSLQANHILLWGAVISLPLSVILNYLFMQWLGVAGIALSTSMVYFVSFCYLLYMLLGLLKENYS
jgi:putative peptidoglycan lipid II flippase